MTDFLVRFVDLLFTALSFAIFGRIILSWISPRAGDPLSVLLFQITEPILAPIRRVVPPFGMFDLTPMIALIAINVIGRGLVRAL